MNKVILMGRLTRDPEVRYSQGNDQMAIARYTLAVDRRFNRNGDQTADFINCVAFGRSAEFAEKYLKQGTKIVATGRIQTGSYTNKDGATVYAEQVLTNLEQNLNQLQQIVKNGQVQLERRRNESTSYSSPLQTVYPDSQKSEDKKEYATNFKID